MPFILTPSQQVGQPKSLVQLNPRHPLYRDIVFAYSAGLGPVDGRHGAGSVVGAVTRSVGPKGKRVIPADATSYVNFPNSEDYNTLGAVTVVAVVRTTTSTVSQQGLVTKCETGGGTNTPFAFLIEGNAYPAINRANAGFRVWRAGTALSDNTEYVIATSQGADISVAPRFYINGAFDAAAAVNLYSGTGTGAPTGNTTSVKLGNRTDLASQCSTFLYDAVVFKRVLTDAQIADLSRNIHQVWQAPDRKIWVATSSNVSVALSGLSLTSARGSLTPNNSVALSGQSATSARGTLSPSVGSTVALTGLGLTSARGSLSPALSVALSGQALTGSRGTLSPATQIGLSGQALTSAQGSVSVSGSTTIALTGQSLTAGQGTLSPSSSSSVALTGQAITATGGALSPANAVTLSGQYVTSAQGSVAVSTAIALSGQSVTIGQGSLAIVGDVSIQLSGLQLSIDVGDLVASTGALSSIVERTAIFNTVVERTVTFQRTKSVNVRFN